MAVKFFGQFLVEKGVISREALLQAIQLQETVNLGFGDHAVAMGIMTESDVTRVNQAQRAEDLRFGDMAVKLGILTGTQLQDVLAKQKSSHLFIGEALVKVGGLSSSDLERHLSEFKVDQAKYATDSVTIPAGTPHPEVCTIIVDLTSKMLTRIGRLTFRLESGRLAAAPVENDIAASMGFTGDVRAMYVLTVSRPVQKKIAMAILDEPDVEQESQGILDDTLMEFINVVCGNVAAKAAQLDTSLDITPPLLIEQPGPQQMDTRSVGVSFPICFSDGERAELFLSVLP